MCVCPRPPPPFHDHHDRTHFTSLSLFRTTHGFLLSSWWCSFYFYFPRTEAPGRGNIALNGCTLYDDDAKTRLCAVSPLANHVGYGVESGFSLNSKSFTPGKQKDNSLSPQISKSKNRAE